MGPDTDRARAGCGCPTTDPDAPGARGVSRRGLLRAGLGGAALGAVASVVGPTSATRYAFAAGAATPYAATPYAADTLVVLSLRGGFDALNAVVPAADPNYLRLRPTIGIPSSSLLPLDSTFGLHPAMAPLYPFWGNGMLAAVHAVGQPEPTRSHFEAMYELERAAPGSTVRTGWLDRVVGLRATGTSFQTTQVGDTAVPMALTGPTPELTMSELDRFALDAAWDADEVTRWARALAAVNAQAPAAVKAPATTTLGALATAHAVASAAYVPAGGAVYPDSDLGSSLRDVARLVKARVGLQVACVDYGDWDMHAGMGDVDSGWMVDHLADLAGSLAAFATDLGPAMSSTTVVTLTEFGRRVEENGSGGVDHGLGTAMLLLGGGVVGGRVHGAWPGLSDSALVDGDLAGRNDYRQVLAEVLTKRCGLADATSVFPGLVSNPLGALRSRG